MTPTTIDKKSITLQCNLWTAGMIAIDNLCSMPWEMAQYSDGELASLNTLMTALVTQTPDDHDCPCDLSINLDQNQVKVLVKISTWFERHLCSLRPYIAPLLQDRLSDNIAQLQQLSLRLSAYENAYSSN